MSFKADVEFLGFRLVAGLFSRLPVETASGLMGGLWRAVAPWLPRHQRALKHIELAFPDMAAAERERIAREMWRHLGRTFAESFHLQSLARDGRVVMADGAKLKMVQDNGPYVVCAMHLGNWELLAGVSERLARPLAGVYQPLKNRKVDMALYQLRAASYPLGLYPRSPATLRRLMKIAKEGGSLGFLADLREGKGAAVPFFGRPAHSNTAPALIARSFGLKLYAACVVREPGVRFRVHVEPVEVPVTGDRDADVLAATANVQARFEAYLRLAPEQWMWAHRRWD